MLTYQIRKRIYHTAEGTAFSFPNSAEIDFEFEPLQPFGMEAGNGRTCVRAVAARTEFNANTGRHTIQSDIPLSPLEVEIEEPPMREFELKGNLLSIKTRFESFKEMDEFIQSVFFGYPMLLNIEFADPPVVAQVHGKVGNVMFRWELTRWKMEFESTTQDEQETKAKNSWLQISVISEPARRRLIAALHYFHVACRLIRVGHSPWEFMSEAILNFSKVLEVLFPPEGDGKTIDAARTGLQQLGYTRDEIERDFIPAIALRNRIDVSHVHLSLLTQKQLQVLHSYTEAIERSFRILIRRILDQTKDGSYGVAPYANLKADSDIVRIINRLERYYGS